jgi:hypothetical protein
MVLKGHGNISNNQFERMLYVYDTWRIGWWYLPRELLKLKLANCYNVYVFSVQKNNGNETSHSEEANKWLNGLIEQSPNIYAITWTIYVHVAHPRIGSNSFWDFR